ncbi:transporter [Corynebacterium yudongzhengii]|uniref:Formate/nitrite transporter family protein n=1 Tax=Corynebacterium yudongzhengii TaxID=2080740 RepID=A0A2U1T9U9_9CORY|nr:formate/nitrite transporter family protein [Corynebacterium yudongzhengii]AWB81255.1 transporter [Corynebacterium yudongzhengii]PWC02794.1 formate/nitrite transporter family protein [Corynebacterium yudongzhengii]
MALNDTIEGGVNKKVTLMQSDVPRFGVRAILAGVYLTLGTGFAVAAGNAVESAVPGHGLGALVFALFFGLGLFAIVILNTELATGNMMFGSYGATTGQIGWGKALWFMLFTTIFNLIGVILIAVILGLSGKFGGFDETHLAITLTEGKLDKTWWEALLEGMAANFVVNMAIVAALFAKEFVSKFFVIIPIIAIFVGLGLEHVIANFSLMSIAGFADLFNGGGAFGGGFPLGDVLWNWLWVWIGNFIGGGLLIGGVYAWLNKGNEVYRD